MNFRVQHLILPAILLAVLPPFQAAAPAADAKAKGQLKPKAKVDYVLQPEDLVAYLDELGAPKLVEQTVRGYRVKVSYAGKRDDDARRQAISRVLLRGGKRTKGVRVRPET